MPDLASAFKEGDPVFLSPIHCYEIIIVQAGYVSVGNCPEGERVSNC
jgi:hypothetical protein